MHIEHLKLKNFRSYKAVELYPNKGISVIYGKNGSGKTNLLEAIHYCCFGRSHRTSHDREVIKKDEGFASIRLKIKKHSIKDDVEIRLNNATNSLKTALVYQKPLKNLIELIGHASCVFFAPEDLSIIKDGPQDRRRFLDMHISEVRPRYCSELGVYLKLLANRNALLKQAQKDTKKIDMIEVWDIQLCKYAQNIINQRIAFCKRLNELVGPIYTKLCAKDKEIFKLNYNSKFADSKNIEQDMMEMLKSSIENDVRRGSTSYGPHRDDIDFYLNEFYMKEYASQGQIRTAALALKLALIKLIEEMTGEKPILMLDDVFSELDTSRRQALLDYVKDIQSFITCTDISDLGKAHADCYINVFRDEENNSNIKIHA